MQLVILATGKCRDAHMRALESEYLGRLPGFWRVAVKELADGEMPESEAAGQLAAFAALPKPAIKVVLDERGAQVDSRGFARKIAGWQGDGVKALAVLIGGANGVHETVKKQADWVWSLGKLTMPHQLVRVVLAEQVYRAWTLGAGHPYHRD